MLLISCYELGHQPIGIAQPMGFLKRAGYRPAAMDIAVEEFDPERARRAGFVGISVPMHTALRLGVRVAEAIRRINPTCHICFYGLYAPLNAEFLLNHVADSVIGGEYERPLVELVDALDRHAFVDAFSEIEGVSVRGKPAAPALNRFPAGGPPPDRRDLPPLTRYAKLEQDDRQRAVGSVEASRGCLHTCLHCPIVPVYEGRFFLVPADVVIKDIRQQVEAGADHITFSDPDFLNGPGHSMNIVRALHAEFPHVTFDFTAKIEHILKRRSLFPELQALGCLFVVSAVESFSNVVLAHLKKGHTRDDVLTALEIVRRAGMTLRPSLVAFTPWTTLADYLEMFDLVEAYDLIEAIDPVQYSIRLLVPPGSALLDAADLPNPVRRFLGPLDQGAFQYGWTHPDPRMDDLHGRISLAVEQAAQRGDEPNETFDRLRAIACAVAGRPIPVKPSSRPRNSRLPRLTESWFCCAEPTKEQLVMVRQNRSCE
jgi:radical SAM superfamily enzyme YgiQ (UPF0313 family)